MNLSEYDSARDILLELLSRELLTAPAPRMEQNDSIAHGYSLRQVMFTGDDSDDGYAYHITVHFEHGLSLREGARKLRDQYMSKDSYIIAIAGPEWRLIVDKLEQDVDIPINLSELLLDVLPEGEVIWSRPLPDPAWFDLKYETVTEMVRALFLSGLPVAATPTPKASLADAPEYILYELKEDRFGSASFRMTHHRLGDSALPLTILVTDRRAHWAAHTLHSAHPPTKNFAYASSDGWCIRVEGDDEGAVSTHELESIASRIKFALDDPSTELLPVKRELESLRHRVTALNSFKWEYQDEPHPAVNGDDYQANIRRDLVTRLNMSGYCIGSAVFGTPEIGHLREDGTRVRISKPWELAPPIDVCGSAYITGTAPLVTVQTLTGFDPLRFEIYIPQSQPLTRSEDSVESEVRAPRDWAESALSDPEALAAFTHARWALLVRAPDTGTGRPGHLDVALKAIKRDFPEATLHAKEVATRPSGATIRTAPVVNESFLTREGIRILHGGAQSSKLVVLRHWDLLAATEIQEIERIFRARGHQSDRPWLLVDSKREYSAAELIGTDASSRPAWAETANLPENLGSTHQFIFLDVVSEESETRYHKAHGLVTESPIIVKAPAPIYLAEDFSGNRSTYLENWSILLRDFGLDADTPPLNDSSLYNDHGGYRPMEQTLGWDDIYPSLDDAFETSLREGPVTIEIVDTYLLGESPRTTNALGRALLHASHIPTAKAYLDEMEQDYLADYEEDYG